jgi:hypothetical protein
VSRSCNDGIQIGVVVFYSVVTFGALQFFRSWCRPSARFWLNFAVVIGLNFAIVGSIQTKRIAQRLCILTVGLMLVTLWNNHSKALLSLGPLPTLFSRGLLPGRLTISVNRTFLPIASNQIESSMAWRHHCSVFQAYACQPKTPSASVWLSVESSGAGERGRSLQTVSICTIGRTYRYSTGIVPGTRTVQYRYV